MPTLRTDDYSSLTLKQLYGELPEKIKILVKKGSPTPWMTTLTSVSKLFYSSNDVYDERDNPNYPEESYEAFVQRMIEKKKLKIEKVLDLK